jgi:lipopolysaccharide export system permease protein
MSLIDRYIIKEIVRPMAVVCLVLISIFASYCAARYLADATAGILPADTVLYLILLKVVIAMEVLLPVTLYLSIIIGLGRLHSDNEMTAMIACGITDRRIYLNILSFTLIICLIVASISIFIRPWAYQLSYRLKTEAKANFQVSRMDPESFYEIDDGRRVLFAGSVNHRKNQVKTVFIRTEDENQQQIITAPEAFQQKDQNGNDILVFHNGVIYTLGKDNQSDTIARFQRYVLFMTPPEILPSERIKAISTSTLMQSPQRVALAERQWRFSTPFTAILLALFAIPLSRTQPRRGRYGKVIAAIGIYGFFYALSLTVKAWVGSGSINPLPGIWWVQITMILSLIFLTLRPGRWQ